ncbi:hypothetical protein ACS0TY_011259 [Phlomoides rotata]
MSRMDSSIGTSQGAEGKFASLEYHSSEEDIIFLSRCFSGQLKEIYPWTEVKSDIEEVVGGRFHVKFRGGDLVFLHPEKDQSIYDKDLVNISKWFEYLAPWCEKDVHNVRLIWSNWYGVPMHAWNMSFFKLIGLKFGKLIKVDEDTLSKN